MDQAIQLAEIHAEKELPEKGEGYEVTSFSVGNTVFGSMNKDGLDVGKRKIPSEKEKSPSTGRKRGRKPAGNGEGKKSRKETKSS